MPWRRPEERARQERRVGMTRGLSGTRLVAQWISANTPASASKRLRQACPKRHNSRGLGGRGGDNSGCGGTRGGGAVWERFWAWTTRADAALMPLPRYSGAWWKEAALRCSVFAVTGSSALLFMRPVLRRVLNEPTGSLLEGPNSYRAASLALLSPVYGAVLCVVGTAAGRHVYFANMASKIWGRFLPTSARQHLMSMPPQTKVVLLGCTSERCAQPPSAARYVTESDHAHGPKFMGILAHDRADGLCRCRVCRVITD